VRGLSGEGLGQQFLPSVQCQLRDNSTIPRPYLHDTAIKLVVLGTRLGKGPEDISERELRDWTVGPSLPN
jgi:hypothetical protein